MRKRHDEFLVAVAKGLLRSGWAPKQVAKLLGIPHRAVTSWGSGETYKDLKPDFSVAIAMLNAATQRLEELGLRGNAPKLPDQ